MDVQDNSSTISVNPQGGVHQQGGAASSGTIQGGEHDKQDVTMTTRQRKPKQNDDKRMGESNSDVNMKENGKTKR